jgi:hypothetical protein
MTEARDNAGAPDIEITDEMVLAGLSAIQGFELIDAWDGYLERDELIRSIYRRMALAACSESPRECVLS